MAAPSPEPRRVPSTEPTSAASAAPAPTPFAAPAPPPPPAPRPETVTTRPNGEAGDAGSPALVFGSGPAEIDPSGPAATAPAAVPAASGSSNRVPQVDQGPQVRHRSRFSPTPKPPARSTLESHPVDAIAQPQRSEPAHGGASGPGPDTAGVQPAPPEYASRQGRLARLPVAGRDAPLPGLPPAEDTPEGRPDPRWSGAGGPAVAAPTPPVRFPGDASTPPARFPSDAPTPSARLAVQRRPSAGDHLVPSPTGGPIRAEPRSHRTAAPQRPRLISSPDSSGVPPARPSRPRMRRASRQLPDSRASRRRAETISVARPDRRSLVQRAVAMIRRSRPAAPPIPPQPDSHPIPDPARPRATPIRRAPSRPSRAEAWPRSQVPLADVSASHGPEASLVPPVIGPMSRAPAAASSRPVTQSRSSTTGASAPPRPPALRSAPRTLARAPSRSSSPAQPSSTPPSAQASSRPPPLSPTSSPSVALARATTAGPASAAVSTPGAGGSAGAGAGGGDTGGDSDAAYRDLLRRVRDEQEQLGQLIPHPF
jgi:hypothetical protein